MAKRAAKSGSGSTSAGGGDGQPAEPAIVHPITLLEQVIGQDQAKRILQSAMVSGRIHHAWIFHGPAGVGKMTTAVAFAAALLDPTTGAGLMGGSEVAPETGSTVQNLVRQGNHPDLHVITKELAVLSRDKQVRDGKQTSIAREVLDEFLLEPAAKTRVVSGESRMGKVFIIDEAEMVTPAVQNILLKTLEEPPSGTAIILVTSNEDRLLATVRSRSQRVGFTTLDDKQMDQWLKASGPAAAVDGPKLAWVKMFAGGSPGLAKLAVESDLYQWHQTLEPMLAEVDKGRFPYELGGVLAKMIGERAEADVKANPDASKDAANKAWGRRMLAFLAERYRAQLRARALGGGGGGVGPDDVTALRAFGALEAVQGAESHLASNVNMGLLLENLAAQLAGEPAGI